MILMLQIEDADSSADVRTGWVLDNFPKNLHQTDALQEAGLMPDILYCLRDRDGNQGMRQTQQLMKTTGRIANFINSLFCRTVLKRLYERNKESVDEAVSKRLYVERETQPAKRETNLETVVEESGGTICSSLQAV